MKTNRRKVLLTIAGYCCVVLLSAQNVVIENSHLKLELNNELQTKVNTGFVNAQLLTNIFSSSEYLVTKYFIAKNFQLNKKERKNIHDAAGNGAARLSARTHRSIDRD